MKPARTETKSARRDVPPAASVSLAHRTIVIPEIKTMRALRRALADGGLPARDKRTPEEGARITGFRALEELCRFLEDFRRRVESGERCRLVEREHARKPGRLLIEFAIEEDT